MTVIKSCDVGTTPRSKITPCLSCAVRNHHGQADYTDRESHEQASQHKMQQVLVICLTAALLPAFCGAEFAASLSTVEQLARHRHLSTKSDYDILCERFESIYGTCACSMNPDAALGVISTSAFISCTPPNKVVEANFTSNERYLSALL